MSGKNEFEIPFDEDTVYVEGFISLLGRKLPKLRRSILDFIVISVASEMITLKRFCAVVKALIINFFLKNFFLPYA